MDTRMATRFSPYAFSLFLLLALFLGACSSDTKETAEQESSQIAPSEDMAALPLDPVRTSGKRKSEKAAPVSPPADKNTVSLTTQPSGLVQWDQSTAPMIEDTFITTDLTGGEVTNPKISDNAVTTDRIAAGEMMNRDVRPNETGVRISQNESIQTQTIQDGQIMSADIAVGAVMSEGVLDDEWANAVQGDVQISGVLHGVVASNAVTRDATTGAVKIPDSEWEKIYYSGNPWNGMTEYGQRYFDSIKLALNEQANVPEIIPDVQQIPEPEPVYENNFRAVVGSPYSTFSIDVDNASYSNVRGYLSRGTLPPSDAVRIEELINYFDYDYPDPVGEHPFAFHSEVVNCPWNNDHLVLRLALQGKRIQPQQAAASNLVFLIDVSGSMSDGDKLPLLKQSFVRFVDELRPQDQVAIVVYAGAAGLVLESTPGSDKAKIKAAINRLESGGSTAGGAGIELAYKVARNNFLPGGVNRVILATDGDFNVGVRGDAELVALIEEKRKDGVFLSILGFGTGNYQDTKMEKLADNGNGNYYYIDNKKEGQRVLVDAMSGTLFAIAKDVKLQIKFNPAKVAAYRLIGYENRVLAAKDFDNDAKDAGELGAGHTVTALYEVVPVGSEVGFALDTTKGEEYQLEENRPELLSGNDLLLARLRYKEPTDSVSKLIEHLVPDTPVEPAKATEATRFAMAVAQWGMLLRGSKYVGSGTHSDLLTQANNAMGHDPNGYRKEFVELVEKGKSLVETRDAVGTR